MFFSKKNHKEEKQSLKLSKVGERPNTEEAEKFEPLVKKLPENIREIDNQLILDIMDRLHGPDGVKYENFIREVNKDFEPRKGKSGNQFYDESVIAKKKHNVKIGKIINN